MKFIRNEMIILKIRIGLDNEKEKEKAFGPDLIPRIEAEELSGGGKSTRRGKVANELSPYTRSSNCCFFPKEKGVLDPRSEG